MPQDEGDPWEFEPHQEDFWARVRANEGRAPTAEEAARRKAQGFMPPRMPAPGVAADIERAAASRRQRLQAEITPGRAPAAAAPAPAPTAAPPPAPLPEQTIVTQPPARHEEDEWGLGRYGVTTFGPADLDEQTARAAAVPATPPAAALPPPGVRPSGSDTVPTPAPAAAAPPRPGTAPAETPAENPVDAQIRRQGGTRRTLSDDELIRIRRGMNSGRLDEAPTFNPLVDAKHDRNLPPEERARESLTDRLFGYAPKNRVTRRQIIEEVDRLLLERGWRRPN